MRVYIEDTDAGGVVYYVNYLKFMERARTEYLRSLGYGKAGANREGGQFMVVSASIAYKKPAFLDDELSVTAKLKKSGAASAVFSQSVTREGMLLSEGEVKVAWVDAKTLKPMVLPEAMRRDISKSFAE